MKEPGRGPGGLLAAVREAVFLSMANWLPRFDFLDRKRYLLLRMAGMDIRGRGKVLAPITVQPVGRAGCIHIGRFVFINTGVRFGVPGAKVVIGERVQIGPGVMFETASHGARYEPAVGRGTFVADIVVEDEAWIGAGAIVTQGVRVGRGAVVAAGAVVVQDVEPMTVVGGVPARRIRSLDPAPPTVPIEPL